MATTKGFVFRYPALDRALGYSGWAFHQSIFSNTRKGWKTNVRDVTDSNTRKAGESKCFCLRGVAGAKSIVKELPL
jgi:hypothetical protein